MRCPGTKSVRCETPWRLIADLIRKQTSSQGRGRPSIAFELQLRAVEAKGWSGSRRTSAGLAKGNSD